MMRTGVSTLALCFAWMSSAWAQEAAIPSEAPEPPAPVQEAPKPAPARNERPFQLGVEYRFWVTGLSPYAVDSQGTLLDQVAFSEHRLRVSPVWKITPRFRLKGQADLLTGLLAGDTSALLGAASDPRNALGGLESARGRELFAEYRFLGTPEKPGGALRAGLQTSQFGLGMLTNDGKNDEQDFGLKRFGDESFRVLLGMRPLAIATQGKAGIPWQLILAGDVVRKDALANFAAGDRAMQGVAALEYITEPLHFGVYGAIRRQTAPIDAEDSDAETLDVNVADVFFSYTRPLGIFSLSLAGEGAVAVGQTTLTRSQAFPDGTQIVQGGGLLRAGVKSGPLGLELEGGYASGDSNPQDGTTTNFTFNRDYNVSLLLFDQILGDLSARDATRASDPNTIGVPPDGVELLPTDGGVSGATYAKFTARYQPNRDLKLVGALLYAHATADLVAPFASFENGGAFSNFLGGDPTRRSLGVEGDLALRYRAATGRVPVDVGLQAGLFLPGAAFSDAEGNKMPPVYSLQAGLMVPLDFAP